MMFSMICLECDEISAVEHNNFDCPRCGKQDALDYIVKCSECGDAIPSERAERCGASRRPVCRECFEERLVSARELLRSHRALCLQGL